MFAPKEREKIDSYGKQNRAMTFGKAKAFSMHTVGAKILKNFRCVKPEQMKKLNPPYLCERRRAFANNGLQKSGLACGLGHIAALTAV